jgi:integrase
VYRSSHSTRFEHHVSLWGGGKIYIIPITEPITLVLKGQEGNHPEFVFTFEAKTNDRQGQRYPLTKHVVRYYWDLLGLGKRWHDVRHTFGTRLYGIVQQGGRRQQTNTITTNSDQKGTS